MFQDSVCAIARLWVQTVAEELRDAKRDEGERSEVEGYATRVFEIMAELENDDSNMIRWLLMKGFYGPSLDTSHQYLLYRTEHLRVLDESRRISQEMQLRASLLSIEESKRGIEQSKQVGRLTQLAFVFIPLTFVTGVFGMNITPFGGHAPLWKFWVTAGTISGIAFIIGLMTVWSDLWRKLQQFGPVRTMLIRRQTKKYNNKRRDAVDIKTRKAETDAQGIQSYNSA